MDKCIVCGKPAKNNLSEEITIHVKSDDNPPQTIKKRAHFCSENCRKTFVFLMHYIPAVLDQTPHEILADHLYHEHGIDYMDTFYMIAQLQDINTLQKLDDLLRKVFDFLEVKPNYQAKITITHVEI